MMAAKVLIAPSRSEKTRSADASIAWSVRSLRTYVSRLRQLTDGRLVGHDDGYSFDCAADEVDSWLFEGHC